VSIATQSHRQPITQPETGHEGLENPAPLGPQAGSGEPMIAVRGLTKRYRRVAAVDGLSFDVHAGAWSGSWGETERARAPR
jgi:hypothetical protein